MRSENKFKILYIDGCGSGGMMHYAKNMYENIRKFSNASMLSIKKEFSSDNYLMDKINKYNPFFYIKISRKIINQIRPSIVHFGILFHGSEVIIHFLVKNNIKVICTVHDPVLHQEYRTLWGRFYIFLYQKLIYPYALQQCSLIHVHSSLHKNILLSKYKNLNPDNVYVVQHGGGVIDEILKGNSSVNELSSIRDKNKAALFFGRIEPYKGLKQFYDTVSFVLSKVPDFQLVIAGSGALPEIPSEIKDNIIVINRFIDDDEIKSIMESVSFLVLPYIEGTQTGVIPLASTFNLTVVVTNVGSFSDIVINNKTGFIVEVNDGVGFANAMILLLNDAELSNAMGKEATTYMNANYSWNTVMHQHLIVYQSID